MFKKEKPDDFITTACSIDLGSNSALILIGREANGQIEVVYEDMRTTRLGEGVSETGKISIKAINRAIDTISTFKEAIKEHSVTEIHCIGTSALRCAENRKQVIDEIEKKTGISVEVIDEEEEARLSFISATHSLNIEGRCIVLDVGSYSSQLSWGAGTEIEGTLSLPIGCLILRETFTDEEAGYDTYAIESAIKGGIEDSGMKERADTLVLVGGSAVAGASLLLGLSEYNRRIIHGISVGLDEMEDMAVSLALMSEDAIRQRMAFEPERADIIVPGLIVITRFMRVLDYNIARVSWWGLTYGMLVEIL